MIRLFILVMSMLGLAVASNEAGAQTTITQSYQTLGSCGTSHTGPPIILCAAGSYILGGNITSTTTDAIDITGKDITLDLNGFNVTGNGGACASNSPPPGNACSSGGSLYQISITGRSVVVKNGTVAFGAGTGIDASPSATPGNIVLRDLIVNDNHGYGIHGANDVQVVNVHANNNWLDGISLQSGIVESSSAYYNNGIGIDMVVNGGVVVNSSAYYNAAGGVSLDNGGIANGVSSNSNGGAGFSLANGAHVINSNAYGNVSDGIKVLNGGSSILNTLSSANGGKGYNLDASSCYSQIASITNTGGSVTGGTSSTSICAH